MSLLRRGFVCVGLAVMMVGSSLPRTGFSQTPQVVPSQPQKPSVNLTLPPGPLLPEKFGSWQRFGDATEQTDVAGKWWTILVVAVVVQQAVLFAVNRNPPRKSFGRAPER